MTNDEPIVEILESHFEDDQAQAIASVLGAAASYSEGDALAGAKIAKLDADSYETLTELFHEAGFDVTFKHRMDLVGFTQSAETHDEELNEAVRNL